MVPYIHISGVLGLQFQVGNGEPDFEGKLCFRRWKPPTRASQVTAIFAPLEYFYISSRLAAILAFVSFLQALLVLAYAAPLSARQAAQIVVVICITFAIISRPSPSKTCGFCEIRRKIWSDSTYTGSRSLH